MSRFIVTDSTATLPSYVIQREKIRVLGMQITIDQMSFAEQIEVSSGAILAALRNNREVTTSQPSIGSIRSVYEECIESGASEILSLHLSSELSGTYATCLNVARDFHIPIHVVDSRSIGLGLGFAVMSATHLTQDLVTVGQQVQQQASKSKVWLFVETLDYLRRGGRLGAAESFVGSALQIKPILQIENGRLMPLEKVRTTSRALARLVELAMQAAAEFESPVSVGVQHAGSRAKAQELAEQIGKKLPGTQVMISELGAVLSAHVGPGALGVVVAPHFNS